MSENSSNINTSLNKTYLALSSLPWFCPSVFPSPIVSLYHCQALYSISPCPCWTSPSPRSRTKSCFLYSLCSSPYLVLILLPIYFHMPLLTAYSIFCFSSIQPPVSHTSSTPIPNPNIPGHPSWASSLALDLFKQLALDPFQATVPIRDLRTNLCLLPPTDSLCLIYWDILLLLPGSVSWLFSVQVSLLFIKETRPFCLLGTWGEQQCFYWAVSVQTKPLKYIAARFNMILHVPPVDFYFIGFCPGKFICMFLGCISGIFVAWSPLFCQISCSWSLFETIELPQKKLQSTNFPFVSLLCLSNSS